MRLPSQQARTDAIVIRVEALHKIIVELREDPLEIIGRAGERRMERAEDLLSIVLVHEARRGELRLEGPGRRVGTLDVRHAAVLCGRILAVERLEEAALMVIVPQLGVVVQTGDVDDDGERVEHLCVAAARERRGAIFVEAAQQPHAERLVRLEGARVRAR